MKNKRNKIIDLFRVFACALVIFCHTTYSYQGINKIFTTMELFSMPYFYMVSGYFCYYSEDIRGKELINKYLSKIKHICFLIIMALVLEFVYSLLTIGRLQINISTENILYLIGSNACYFYSKSQPLWFLFSLIYVYIFFCLLVLCRVQFKNLFYIASVLFVILFILQFLFAKGYFTNNFVYRNWLFEGVPIMIIGMLLRKNADKFIMKKRNIVGLLMSGIILLFCESYLNIGFEVTICGIFLAGLIILFSINCDFQFKTTDILSWLGAKCTLIAYIIHLYCADIVRCLINDYFDIDFVKKLFPMLAILFTFIASIIASTLCDSIGWILRKKDSRQIQ